MSSSNSQITSQTQDAPTCDAWAVVSFAEVTGTVIPRIATNEGAGIENPQRVSLGSGKVGYKVSFSDPSRFDSGAYVVLTTPQVTDAGQLALWNVSHGYTSEAWSGTPPFGPSLTDLRSGFIVYGCTLSFDSYTPDAGSNEPMFSNSVCEGTPNYKVNMVVFSLSDDSDRGVTTGKISLAGEGGYGKIGTGNNTSVSQNLGFFDEKKRTASAYGTVVIPPRRGATSVVAYMENAFNAGKNVDGYLNGVSAGGACSIDVAFTRPLDNENYCVILAREASDNTWSFFTSNGDLPRSMRIPYIRGNKERTGFRIEVAAPELYRDPSVTTTNQLRRVTYGVTSDYYSSGFGEKIHFMVFGGTDERIASFTSTEQAWITNPYLNLLSDPAGPLDYAVWCSSWIDPDYGVTTGGGLPRNVSAAVWDVESRNYAPYYTSTSGGVTYTIVPRDPTDPDFSDTYTEAPAGQNGLNSLQSGLYGCVPLIQNYQSGGSGGIEGSNDPAFGMDTPTKQIIWRTIDRLKTVPQGRRHFYPVSIGKMSIFPNYRSGMYHRQEQYFKNRDGFTWSGGLNGITSAGFRLPSGTKRQWYVYDPITAPEIWGITSYNGLTIAAGYASGATTIRLWAGPNGLTLFHNDRLWFAGGSVLVSPPAYNSLGLGVWTAAAGQSRDIIVSATSFTGVVGAGNSACNVAQSVLVLGATFAAGRTMMSTLFADSQAQFGASILEKYLAGVHSGFVEDRLVGQQTVPNTRFDYLNDDAETISYAGLFYLGQNDGITWSGGNNYIYRTYANSSKFNGITADFLYDDLGVSAGNTASVNPKDPEQVWAQLQGDSRVTTYKFSPTGVTTDSSPTVNSLFVELYNELCKYHGKYYRGVFEPGINGFIPDDAYTPMTVAAVTLGSIAGLTGWLYNAWTGYDVGYGGIRKNYPLSSTEYLGGNTYPGGQWNPSVAEFNLYGRPTRINGADSGSISYLNLAQNYPSMAYTYILRELCEGHYRAIMWKPAIDRGICCGNYLQVGPCKPSEALFYQGGNMEPLIAPTIPAEFDCAPSFYIQSGATTTSSNPAAAACYFPNPGNNFGKKYLFNGIPTTRGSRRRMGENVFSHDDHTSGYGNLPRNGAIRFYHRSGQRFASAADYLGGIRTSSWFGITAGDPAFVKGITVYGSFSAGATAVRVSSGNTFIPGDIVRFGNYSTTVFNYVTGGNLGVGGGVTLQFNTAIGFTGTTGDTLLYETAYNNTAFVGFLQRMRHLRAIQRTDPDLWKHFTPWNNGPTDLYGVNRSDSRWWWELMYHLYLAGAKYFMFWSGGAEVVVGDRVDHGLVYVQKVLNNCRKISGNSKIGEPAVTDYDPLNADVIVSGGRIESGPNGGRYLWRLTARPGPLDETVTLTQNTRPDLPATLTIPGGTAADYPHGTRGVWLITKSSVKPEYTIAPASPDAFDSIALAKDQYYPIIFFYNEGGYANDVAGATWANWTGTSVACFQGDPLSASESRAYPWNANPSDLNNTPWHNLVYEQVIDAYKWGARSFHLYLPYGGYARDVYASTYGASAGGNFLLYQQFKDGYTLPSPAGLTHQQPARWKGFPQAINALLTGTMVPPNTQRTPITEPCNVYLYLPGLMGWSNYRRHSCAIWRGLPGTTAEKDAAFYAKLDSMVDVIKSMKPSSPTGKGKLSVNLDVARSTATPESVYLYRTVGDSTAPSASFSGAYLTDALELSDWYVKRKLEAAGIPVFIESRPFNRMNQVLISPTATGISGAVGVTASTGWQGEFVTSDEPWFWGSTNPQNYPESIKQSEIRHLHRMNPQGFRLSDIVVRGASSDPFGIYHTIARGNSFLNFWRGDASLGAGGFTADGDRTQYTPIAAVAHLYALSDHYRHYTNLKNGNSALKGVCFANFNSIGFALSEFKKDGERLVEAQGTNETKYARYSDIHPTAWPVWKDTDVFNGASFDANPRTYATDHQTKFWTANGKQFWQNNVMTSNFNDFITMLSTFSATAAPAFATAQGWAGATYPFDYYSRNTIGAALGLSLGGTNEVN
jgi:hypothetical protein